MDNKHITGAIQQLKVFAPLGVPLRQTVADLMVSIGVLRRINKGTTWMKSGVPSENKGYILLQGSANIRKLNAPESSCIAPELLGEGMQYNPTHTRTASVTATEDCAVLRFEWEEFWKVIGETLSDEQQAEVRKAIEECAWEHFTE